jgi:glucokinase
LAGLPASRLTLFPACRYTISTIARRQIKQPSQTMSHLQTAQPLAIGVDVGGTAIKTLLVDAGLQPLCTHTAPTDTSDREATFASIVGAIEQTLAAAGATTAQLATIGLGAPGQNDPETGVVRLAVNLHWQDFPLTARLTERFGVPAFLDKDLYMATLGVYRFDNPAATRNLAYVAVGTGLAAGIVLDGVLLRGVHGLAGEIGHWIAEPEGALCNCGTRGCLETVVSATGAVRLAREAIARGAATVLRDTQPLTARAVYAAAAAGDAVAIAVVERIGAALGRALRTVLLCYDIEEIVLGGGVTQAGAPFLQPVLDEWARQRSTSELARKILQPAMVRLADPARNMGAWGAAAVALERVRG